MTVQASVCKKICVIPSSLRLSSPFRCVALQNFHRSVAMTEKNPSKNAFSHPISINTQMRTPKKKRSHHHCHHRHRCCRFNMHIYSSLRWWLFVYFLRTQNARSFILCIVANANTGTLLITHNAPNNKTNDLAVTCMFFVYKMLFIEALLCLYISDKHSTASTETEANYLFTTKQAYLNVACMLIRVGRLINLKPWRWSGK